MKIAKMVFKKKKWCPHTEERRDCLYLDQGMDQGSRYELPQGILEW